MQGPTLKWCIHGIYEAPLLPWNIELNNLPVELQKRPIKNCLIPSTLPKPEVLGNATMHSSVRALVSQPLDLANTCTIPQTNFDVVYAPAMLLYRRHQLIDLVNTFTIQHSYFDVVYAPAMPLCRRPLCHMCHVRALVRQWQSQYIS